MVKGNVLVLKKLKKACFVVPPGEKEKFRRHERGKSEVCNLQYNNHGILFCSSLSLLTPGYFGVLILLWGLIVFCEVSAHIFNKLSCLTPSMPCF
jgi:hypothetical protein